MLKQLIFISFLFSLLSCSQKTTSTDGKTKEIKELDCQPNWSSKEFRGVNLVATRRAIDSSHISPIVTKAGANSVAIVPFGFIRSNQANVTYSAQWQWFGEKREGAIEQIKLAKQAGLTVLLKPHIWVHDKWIGDLEFSSEKDWKTFESTYTTFILDFAQIADSMQVEVLCIGVELRKSIIQRPQFWKNLISKIRKAYAGKLTYAANWDTYEKVTFWNQLDYIGVDAYFPVSEEKTPSVDACFMGWETDFYNLKKLSNSHNKPVIFTEFGYRNIDYTGKEPWDQNQLTSFNSEGQINGYNALFCRFQDENWMQGGFLWKWYPRHNQAGGSESNRFTPQNKPIEKEIFKAYTGQE